jgi:hypothetical protein
MKRKRGETTQKEAATDPEAARPVSLDKLPRSVVCHYFSFLGKLDDRANLKLVCKDFNEWTNDNQAWPTCLDLKDHGQRVKSLLTPQR